MGELIPLSIPNFEGNEQKYVNDAVAQGWVSTGGAYITRLEEMLADYLHVEDVAACQSGTSALHMALVRCGIGPGDMVIVPTLTFIAAVNPVKYQFATPVFMDCDDSLCMDPNKLEAFCAEECHLDNKGVLRHNDTNVAVKAMVVVHVFGNMCDMEAIMDIAERYHIKVIEDATEALGSHYIEGKYAGRFAGTIGDYGAYSFNGNKIITTGGGGAVVARERGETAHLRYLSTQAKDNQLYYVHNEVGFNYRMTNVQAAIGVAQMECLQRFIQRKQNNFNYYREALLEFLDIKLIDSRENTSSNCWFYGLELPIEKMNCELKDIIDELQKKYGVQTRPIWGLIHEQVPYREDLSYKIERAKYYSKRVLNIPCSTHISEKEMNCVIDSVRTILEQH